MYARGCEANALHKADTRVNLGYGVMFCLVAILGLSSNRRYKRLKKVEEGMTFIVNGSIAFSQENEVTTKCYTITFIKHYTHCVMITDVIIFMVCCYVCGC